MLLSDVAIRLAKQIDPFQISDSRARKSRRNLRLTVPHSTEVAQRSPFSVPASMPYARWSFGSVSARFLPSQPALVYINHFEKHSYDEEA